MLQAVLNSQSQRSSTESNGIGYGELVNDTRQSAGLPNPLDPGPFEVGEEVL